MGCASSKASEPTAADAIALSPKPADSPKPGTAAAVQPAVQAAPSDAVSLQPAGSGLKVDAAGSPRLASGASITAEPPATLPASSSSLESPKAAPAPAPAVAKAPSAGVAPAPATESESMRELGPQTLYDRSLAPELVAAWEAEQKFTDEQNAAMSELRSRMLPKFNAEHVRLFDNKPSLYRFCQARQFDVDKAELMFTNHLAWRTDNDVSPLVATDLGEVPKICASFTYPQIPAVKQAYQFIHHKTSKAGLPVYIDRVGALNYKELKAAMGDDGAPRNSARNSPRKAPRNSLTAHPAPRRPAKVPQVHGVLRRGVDGVPLPRGVGGGGAVHRQGHLHRRPHRVQDHDVHV